MDSPIYSATDAEGLTLEVFPRFFRVSTGAGDILAEYGAAHVRKLDAGMIPADKLPPGGIPRGALILDRYGDLKPSKRLPIPFGVLPDMDGGALRRAILAMKPAPVDHLQNDDDGCGSAVVAHLTGATYADTVRKLFPRSTEARRIGTARLAAATGTTRRDCRARIWEELQEARAVAALIKNRRGNQHYIAIDPAMLIVDPELVLRYPLAEYPRRAWTPMVYFVRA